MGNKDQRNRATTDTSRKKKKSIPVGYGLFVLALLFSAGQIVRDNATVRRFFVVTLEFDFFPDDEIEGASEDETEDDSIIPPSSDVTPMVSTLASIPETSATSGSLGPTATNPIDSPPLSHYCEWVENGSLFPCKKRILEAFPSIQNATHWYFIGDSTMGRMSSTFPASFTDQMNRMRYSQSFKKSHYYRKVPSMADLFPADELVIANAKRGEGPVPADYQGTTCSTCRNGLYQHIRRPKSWEFLAMEFSKDRSFQTKQTNTSQETMALYMTLSNKKSMIRRSEQQTVCVINTGFHDMCITPDISAQLHVDNTLWMQSLFLRGGHCSVILWLGMNAVSESNEWPQTTARVQEWNDALATAMRDETELSSSLFFIDVFNKSKSVEHADHLHMEKTTFYNPLSAFFADLILNEDESSSSTTMETETTITFDSDHPIVTSATIAPAQDHPSATAIEQSRPAPKLPSHYCEWVANGTLTACREKLLETFPSIQQANHWFFIGDSTMGRMVSTFPDRFSNQMERLRYSEKIHKNKYYKKVQDFWRLLPVDIPVIANATLGEGPFPLDYVGTTCTSCRNGLYRQVNHTRPDSVAWEFLAMEHCKDRSFQTKKTTTSQETMALYIEMANETTSREQTVCVVTTGFHDMRIIPSLSPQLYVQNALWLQHLFLERHCGILIWVGMNAVSNSKRSPQTNGKVKEWNEALLEGMMTEESTESKPSVLDQGAFFLDVYNKSRGFKHADHLHMDGRTFYQPLSAFFADLILDTSDVDTDMAPATSLDIQTPIELSLPAQDQLKVDSATNRQKRDALRFPSHYCEWKANGTLSPCKGRIRGTFPSIQEATHWFFLGDSTMARMTNDFPNKLTFLLKKIRYSSSKKKNHYYRQVPAMDDIIPADELVVANGALGEGPAPADYVGTGCTTCRNGLYRQRNYTITPLRPPIAVEFLALEFSKDRSFQTKITTTSQETMALYMELANETTSREETVCVATTGFHDMQIVPPMSAQLYVQNTLWMQYLFLKRHCGILIWMDMNAVSNSTSWPQTNDKVEEWNEALLDRMMTEDSTDDNPSVLEQGAFFLDIYDKSKSTKHADHLHMDGTTFYEPLAAFFADLILNS